MRCDRSRVLAMASADRRRRAAGRAAGHGRGTSALAPGRVRAGRRSTPSPTSPASRSATRRSIRAIAPGPASPSSGRTTATSSRRRSPARCSSATPSASWPGPRRSTNWARSRRRLPSPTPWRWAPRSKASCSGRSAQPGNAEVRSVNALVGETNDGGLNDIRTLAVRPEHVLAALTAARAGAVEEGSVGAGHGHARVRVEGRHRHRRRAGWRRASAATRSACSCRATIGGVLTMDGAPVGKRLGRYAYQPSGAPAAVARRAATARA